MRIKLDENLPGSLAGVFRSAGHDTATVLEEGLAGAGDSLVLGMTASEGRVLITLDGGFANILNHPPGSHAGIVVFRLGDQRRAALENAAERLIRSGILERLRHGLAVVDAVRIRTRPATSTPESPPETAN